MSAKTSFNSQPPEDGWPLAGGIRDFIPCFNSQPPEDGWQEWI